MGYDVDPGAADSYTLPPLSLVGEEAPAAPLALHFGDDILRGQKYFPDRSGRLIPFGGEDEPNDKDAF
jgi:hypothetical protein